MSLINRQSHHKHETHVHNHAPDKIEITEKRAPTDDSIRLANEMKERAKKDILVQMDVHNNTFNALGIAFSTDFSNMNPKIFIKFKLNEKEYICEKSIDYMKYNSIKLKSNSNVEVKERILSFLIDKLSEVIATEVLRKNLPTLSQNIDLLR